MEYVSTYQRFTEMINSNVLEVEDVCLVGEDMVLSDYVGTMGFDEVTDWEYYYQNEEDPEDRNVVQPNPFDSSKPKRTRKSSGSVVSVTFPMCFFLITKTKRIHLSNCVNSR